MTARTVTVLAVDWERLRRAYPDLDDRALGAEALARGLRLASSPQEDRPPRPGQSSPGLRELREAFARHGARVAVHRFTYATSRDRFDRAARREAEAAREQLRLEREVVPALKARARALRDALREVEGALRARGLDPDRIGPPVDWRTAPLLDEPGPPGSPDPAPGREDALRFFRRLRTSR
jgi:hypothetical protein